MITWSVQLKSPITCMFFSLQALFIWDTSVTERVLDSVFIHCSCSHSSLVDLTLISISLCSPSSLAPVELLLFNFWCLLPTPYAQNVLFCAVGCCIMSSQAMFFTSSQRSSHLAKQGLGLIHASSSDYWIKIWSPAHKVPLHWELKVSPPEHSVHHAHVLQQTTCYLRATSKSGEPALQPEHVAVA